jgi:large subunit ribosomal protein L21e
MLMRRPRPKAVCGWNKNLNLYTYAPLSVERINLKRVPVLPRGARTVSTTDNTPQTIVPVPYETTI